MGSLVILTPSGGAQPPAIHAPLNFRVIVLGLLSQLVGAWSGGIPALGILASGASG
jgi:hypothetical protein